MRRLTTAALLTGSLLAVPSAQTAPAPSSVAQTPAGPPIRGPRLDSPELVSLGPGVKSPVVIKEVKPTYPSAAMSAGLQGVVGMDAVVLTDGTVGDVKVTKSLGEVLDKEAVATLRKWTFRPATAEGKVVPVKVEVEMAFTLRAKPPK